MLICKLFTFTGVQVKTILRYAQSRAKIYKEFDKNILHPKIIYRTYTLAEKIKALFDKKTEDLLKKEIMELCLKI